MIRWLVVAILISLAFPRAARAEEPESWYPEESPTTSNLHAVSFAPDGVGWAVGEDGAVLRHDGERWRIFPGPSDRVILRCLAALGGDELWASGGGGQMYHHAAGRWIAHPTDASFSPETIAFLHPGLGYAAGLFGGLYRFDGQRWDRVRSPAIPADRESHLFGVAILAEDDVWVGGNAGFVLHFDGSAWQRIEPRPSGVGGRLQRLGDTIALLDAPVLVRRDAAWQPLGPISVLEIAAHGGSIWGVHFGEGSLVRLAPGNVERFRPSRAISSIAAGPDGIWAVGDHGLILHLKRGRLPTFTDGTFEAGVGALAESRAAFFADLDESGAPDILLATPLGRNSFLRAEPGAGFHPQPLAAPEIAALPVDARVAVADMDGDGRADLLLRPPGSQGARPIHLWRSLGAFRFFDAGPSAAPLSAEDAAATGSLEVADLDGDLDLDVYETRFLQDPGGLPMPNVIWRNDGLGHLDPVALAHRDGGASLAWSRAALAADLDGDGRTDLLSLNSWGDGNTFFRQTADGALVDATRGSGIEGAIQDSVGAAVGDVDGDGALDVLMLTGLPYGPSRLFRGDGRGHFHDVTSASGIDRVFAMAARAEFADMDLDGDLDLVVSGAQPRNPSSTSSPPPAVRLLLNDGHGVFTDVTSSTGIALSAVDILVDDLDGDGDEDIYAVRPGESNRLLVNNVSSRGWLKIALHAAPPNRAAIGARVSVIASDGKLVGVRETSWRHPIAHFGLGDADRVRVEVRFPSGRVVQKEGIRAGQTLEISERAPLGLHLGEAAFFLRHRWAWADKPREGVKLLAAIAIAIAMIRLGPRLGARRWARRWPAPAAVVSLHGALALALMPLEPVARWAGALPLAAAFTLGAGIVLFDRAWTRRAEARFVGPYELIGVLGQGGMGIVYRARDTTLPGRPIVALKVLRPERVEDPMSRRRFVREADLGARLCHPGIAAVRASGECRVLEGRAFRNTAYLAMEYVEGSSLATILASGERLPLARALEIVRDAAEAVAAAHAAGILHRDIKPDNLLVSRAGVVKLVDFGIAAIARPSAWTEGGMLVGTLSYLPPERIANKPEDARGDLYAIGAVLYEVVTGHRPFEDTRDAAALLKDIVSNPPPPPSIPGREIPPRLAALMMRLLAKDPADRPGSARQVIDALNAALREISGESPIEEAIEPLARDPEGDAPTAPVTPPRRPQAAVDRETLDLPRSEVPFGPTPGPRQDS